MGFFKGKFFKKVGSIAKKVVKNPVTKAVVAAGGVALAPVTGGASLVATGKVLAGSKVAQAVGSIARQSKTAADSFEQNVLNQTVGFRSAPTPSGGGTQSKVMQDFPISQNAILAILGVVAAIFVLPKLLK